MENWLKRFLLVFMVLVVGASVGFAAEVAAICDVPVSQKICYVESEFDRKCLDKPDALKYADIETQLDYIYEVAPHLMKAAMCALDKIKVAKDLGINVDGLVNPLDRKNILYLGWQGAIRSQSPYRNINLLIYKYPSDLNAEHGAFFSIVDGYKLTGKTTYSKQFDEKLNHNLAKLIFHELAHTVEKQKTFNQFAPLDIFRCFDRHQVSDKLGYVSKSGRIKGYYKNFPEQFGEGLDSDIIYELFTSDYSTFYSLHKQNEDFAEMMAEYIMLTYFGINYRVSKGDELLFDRAEQFKHNNIQPKLNIIKTMLALHEMSEDARKAFFQDQVHCRGDFKVE
uniref:Substrate import-associated zinc metallohydrolase lipoprotein n=1 Tax=OCS116 cluster bacterium TaxID=2030921 RepID=A0A2A4YR80_9PROT